MNRSVCLAVFAALFAAPLLCHADPPRNIALTFDPATKYLKVVMDHPSRDIQRHYIKQVEVTIAGIPDATIIQQTRTQTGAKGQELIFVLPDARSGARISVTGTCSITGTRTAVLTTR